ncbi:MAG: BatD family protein [Terrimicrobiaceae bacterium]
MKTIPKHFLILIAAGFLLPWAMASGQEVSAELSSGTAAVGEPVEFVITAVGKSQAQLVDELAVDGLSVAATSEGFQMQIGFPRFEKKVTTTIRMTLVPTREGEFSIPPMRVRLEGKVFKTLPSVLTVRGSRGGGMLGGVPVRPAIPVPPGGGQMPRLNVPPTAQPPPNQPPAAAPAPSGKPAKGYFGEMVIPRETIYVGEVVPVDLRFYIDGRFPAQFSERPSFGGEGFTVQRTAQPTEANREIDGIPYSCIIYRTAITAAKAGPLTVPSASVAARVQVPVQAPRGMDSFFDSFIQGMGMTDIKEIEIVTEPTNLEVKPLPMKDRPESFDGAVGEFQIDVSASPKKAAEGEPITLKVKVSGRGNFEAMGPPKLVDADGWRVYDPAKKFEPSPTDPIGYNGEMTYEFTLVARENLKATPPVRFSYFDPKEEKFVTLDGPPVAVQAAGSSSAASPAATTAAAEATPTPSQPATRPSDLSSDFRKASFQPAAWSPGFLWAGALLALGWLTGLAAILLRRKASSPAARRAAELRQLRASLRKLAAVDGNDFLDRSAAFVDDRLGGRPLDSLGLSSELEEGIRDLLARRERARFSTSPPPPPDEAERQRILENLKAFDARA